MTTRILDPTVQGALRPSRTIVWERDDGTLEPLTGATLTGTITNRGSDVTRAIAGTLTPTDDAANGEFLWEFAAGDVNEAGEFDVQFSAAFDPGPSPARTFVARWKVERYRTATA
jgi:hypothetical protein